MLHYPSVSWVATKWYRHFDDSRFTDTLVDCFWCFINVDSGGAGDARSRSGAKARGDLSLHGCRSNDKLCFYIIVGWSTTI